MIDDQIFRPFLSFLQLFEETAKIKNGEGKQK
jgi:hypothetical protein